VLCVADSAGSFCEHCDYHKGILWRRRHPAHSSKGLVGEFLRMPIFRHYIELLCGLDRDMSRRSLASEATEYFFARVFCHAVTWYF
jgi:hypothetical protein